MNLLLLCLMNLILLNSSFLISDMVNADRYSPQNKFFLESSIIECEGGPETKRFENCCSSRP